MKHSFFFFLLFCGINLYGQSNSNSMYMIEKIVTKKKYYRIEATRNDSTFLIISYKEDVPDTEDLSKIKKGESYYLDIINMYKLLPPVDGRPVTGIIPWADVIHTTIVSANVTIELKLTEKYHFSVYRIYNLRGLYYMPPQTEK